MKFLLFLSLVLFLTPATSVGQALNAHKPRILISSDIGGTDPDDNQSLAHLLMYSNEFRIEGLISTASFGSGSASEILRMIDVYEQDLPRLSAHIADFTSPDNLRAVTKQGCRTAAPYCGFSSPTEGSEWIIKCARTSVNEPLYVLVWGGLEDVAQALHDAPDIAEHIRVYWIGGPNKKWSINAYVYIAQNFPNLWMIENNASYRGFIYQSKLDDEWNAGYFAKYIDDHGNLGRDFGHYYKGNPKLGDTPSLLYMMSGDPSNPEGESWGGSFEHRKSTTRHLLTVPSAVRDTVEVFSVLEFHVTLPVDTATLYLEIRRQRWPSEHLGNGHYVIRHSTYYTGDLHYVISDATNNNVVAEGELHVLPMRTERNAADDYPLGPNWYADKTSDGDVWQGYQGAQTIYKWRRDVMSNWAERWNWCK